jgi:hypothetical protein
MLFAAVLTAAVVFPASGQPAVDTMGKPSPRWLNYSEARVRSIEANYGASLKSSNDGVVESAIAHCVEMRWAFPSAKLEDVRDGLGVLATGGKTAAIRYKAYLAGLVYDSPSIFSSESGQEYAQDEDLFAAVSVRAEKVLLGFSGHR